MGNNKGLLIVIQNNYKSMTEVLKKWDRFTKKHKQYSVQDLISMAMLEFINKYS